MITAFSDKNILDVSISIRRVLERGEREGLGHRQCQFSKGKYSDLRYFQVCRSPLAGGVLVCDT